MKSMTGYGRGECAQDGFKITVELSSVNRKQTEISVNLPRELEVLEAQIRDEINRRVARAGCLANRRAHGRHRGLLAGGGKSLAPGFGDAGKNADSRGRTSGQRPYR